MAGHLKWWRCVSRGGGAPPVMRLKKQARKMDPLLKPLLSTSNPLDGFGYPKVIEKGCQKGTGGPENGVWQMGVYHDEIC